MSPVIAALIERHRLQPLPIEGTLFAQTYRSNEKLTPGTPAGTAMVGLYCEEPKSQSLFHRLTFDEVWHFYGGDPLRLILLLPDGTSEDVILGPNAAAGHRVQFVVPAGVWQAGHLVSGGLYALYGCTMSPGWNGVCFEGGTRSQLLATHPDRAADIERFACPDGAVHMPG
jgi:predicted cupin superfamily sugar epimerase